MNLFRILILPSLLVHITENMELAYNDTAKVTSSTDGGNKKRKSTFLADRNSKRINYYNTGSTTSTSFNEN